MRVSFVSICSHLGDLYAVDNRGRLWKMITSGEVHWYLVPVPEAPMSELL